MNDLSQTLLTFGHWTSPRNCGAAAFPPWLDFRHPARKNPRNQGDNPRLRFLCPASSKLHSNCTSSPSSPPLSGFGCRCPRTDICQSEASVPDTRADVPRPLSLNLHTAPRLPFTPACSWLRPPLLVRSVQLRAWKISCDSLALCYTSHMHLKPNKRVCFFEGGGQPLLCNHI